MDSREVFEEMMEKLESTPRPFENEDWYREGIKAAQEKYIKEHFANKIADPE